VLVVLRFNVTFITTTIDVLQLNLQEKTISYFSKDAVGNLTTYGCVLWCSQIVYIRPYSLNTTTTFYFVTECSDIQIHIAVECCSYEGVLSHNTFVLTLPGFVQFRFDVLLYFVCSSVVPKGYGLVNW